MNKTKSVLRICSAVAAITLSAAILVAPLASATGVGYFDTIHEGDKGTGSESIVADSIALKKAKIPFVNVKAGELAALRISPNENAKVTTVQGSDYEMRYLGKEGDYVRAFDPLAGAEVYVLADKTRVYSKSVQYPVRPAGRYSVYTYKETGTTHVDPAAGTTEYTPGKETSENVYDPTKQILATDYYVRPIQGKTVTVRVTGSDVKEYNGTWTSKKGIFLTVSGKDSVVTVTNGEIVSWLLAPNAVIQKQIEASPERYAAKNTFEYKDGDDFGTTEDYVMLTLLD